VEVVALDDYFAEKRVDFVKVDVEGAEAMVLEGAYGLLRRWAPILLVSVHGFTPTHPVLALLESVGYEWAALNEWGSERHVLASAKERGHAG
jgi:hypothetical protein